MYYVSSYDTCEPETYESHVIISSQIDPESLKCRGELGSWKVKGHGKYEHLSDATKAAAGVAAEYFKDPTFKVKNLCQYKSVTIGLGTIWEAYSLIRRVL